jgi:beta-lactamase regulating signal transducer with metallopeptidase domain
VLVVILASHLLERAVFRPADRCAVWNTCFISILFLALAGLVLPRLHLVRPWTFVDPKQLMSVAAAEVLAAKILFGIWSAGAFMVLVRWGSCGLLLYRSLRHCRRLTPKQVQKLLGMSRTAYEGSSMPTLLISDNADGPYCLQLHRPVIVLPQILLDGTRDELRIVLLHELSHLRSNHPLQLFLQQLAQVICWFHPAIWRASRQASLAREYTCDDAVVDAGVKRAAYLRVLLQIAERSESIRRPSIIGFSKIPTELVLRAKRLVECARGKQDVEESYSVTRKWAAVLALVLVTSLLTLVSIPADPMSSSRTRWSAWPTWTARTLHCFGLPVRDYEIFDRRVRIFEQLHENGEYGSVMPSRTNLIRPCHSVFLNQTTKSLVARRLAVSTFLEAIVLDTHHTI